MYYTEKVINGVVHYKTSPSSPWRPLSAEALTERLREKEARIGNLELQKGRLENENRRLTEELSVSNSILEQVDQQTKELHALALAVYGPQVLFETSLPVIDVVVIK